MGAGDNASVTGGYSIHEISQMMTATGNSGGGSAWQSGAMGIGDVTTLESQQGPAPPSDAQQASGTEMPHDDVVGVGQPNGAADGSEKSDGAGAADGSAGTQKAEGEGACAWFNSDRAVASAIRSQISWLST